MRKSVRIIVWFTTFWTVIHGNSNEQKKTLDNTAPQPTNLSLFVDDISILTDLTGGIKRQSRLIENFVKETSRYFQATSKQFDTFYKTKPDIILKYVIDFYEDTRTLVLKSDFQKMLSPVKILKSLAIDSENLGRSIEKKTVQEYISKFETLKKHPPKLEFLWLELIPQLDKCLKPQGNITEIGLCFVRLDVLEMTTVTVTQQFDKIKEVRRRWNPVRKLIQIYASTFEDLEIVVKSAFEFSNNSKTFSGLAESLELANEEFEECETKISEKKSKIAYRMGTVLVGSEVKVEGRTKAFLMRFPEIFVSEFLKNLAGEKHLEMLKYGFQPYLKMSETVQKVEEILEGNKWNKVGADKIRYAIRDIEKWTGPFIIPESLLDTVDKCLKRLPTVKPEFNFELFQSALNQTKTMIYEMRKFVILVDEIVSKQNEIMLALRTLKETFDGWEIRDNVRTFKSYMENIWNENGTEPIKNISSYAKLIESARNFSKTNNIAEMISQHPDINIFMEILEQFDIKRVLDVSECLSERNFHLGHVDKILEGAENMKIFRYNVNDEDIKLTKAYMAEISEILRILEETDSVIRKKTLSEETRKLNSFDRSEKVNTNLGEARDAMKRISMVTDQMSGVTHFIVPTDTNGLFESDDFGYVMCVFLPTLLMKQQWMNECLEKTSNFRNDYKFRIEKIKYGGVVYEAVLKWATWIHKQNIPFLYGVHIHVAIPGMSKNEMIQLRQLVEMHGATWSDEMLVKENFNLGSHPFHHFNLGPLFIIHDGKKNFLKQFQSDTDKMFTLMTFPEFVGFMLKLECHYDNERKMPIPVTFNLENSEL
ncbi:Protein CBG21651 [Caenorhabditis briggsae]|uniref:Protein CBG21651 n=1 Tax=Caenorhabditis briggsae TaxID=6238 RepID=A8Y0T9_CAEBR|nr:Protein CBG21651 [Caenorhabditis briggsae]CAP38509.2 Protein CBG21651 [Caenorhabditis briggsae]